MLVVAARTRSFTVRPPWRARVRVVAYLWSVVAVVAALVGLGLLVVAALGPVRRFTTVADAAGRQIGDEVGMLKARVAALRIRLAQRRA